MLFQLAAGEEMLWGLVGLLSLLSNELAARSSCDGARECVGDALFACAWAAVLDPLERSPRGTGCPMLASFVALVSMVMVGARGRKGPGEGVSLSPAIAVA